MLGQQMSAYGSNGQTALSAAQRQFTKTDDAVEKKDETKKTIEEGLGGLKIMMGGKGLSKAIFNDPMVKKFGSDLKKQAIDGVKKAGQKLLDQLPFENATDRELAQIKAKGVERMRDGEDVFREGYDGEGVESGLKNLKEGDGQLFRPVAGDDDGTGESVTATDELASDGTEAFQLNPISENMFDMEGTAKSLPGELEAGEFGTEASNGLTVAEEGRAAVLSAKIASRVTSSSIAQGVQDARTAATTAANSVREAAARLATSARSALPTTTASGGAIDGTLAGGTDAALAVGGTALDTSGAVAAGDAAAAAAAAKAAEMLKSVQTAQALSKNLDKDGDDDPIVAIVTLAAGAGLSAYAAIKKRNIPVFNPNKALQQSGSAFQAGFGNI